ncbi:hypothetical protein [Citrobacter portucalensis]|uniref:hypothetical protein n=1 Tax=Citrobacter portucalensis TaxID=1639133 RepID=UPI002B22E953|nr:hypothetical protein [Citrobacter portucalensis]MEB0773568.1 hypothetical protein [Citrobacter portucalensis]MEB0840295.1 hypothetical protein [Citrobacter portucalensis]
MDTQIAHISHTDKKGYLWRKRYQKHTIEIILRTRDKSIAIKIAASITIRYIELKSLDVPFEAMREMLKKFRDGLITSHDIERLRSIAMASQDAPQATVIDAPMQSRAQEVKTSQRAAQGHSLMGAQKAYFDANTEWKPKTVKDYNACLDRFIFWCIDNGVSTIEEISKDKIIAFKAYMDGEGLAPLTKSKIITRIGSFLNFCVNIKEWIDKNNITGLQYKKVYVQNPKEEITPEHFKAVMQQFRVINDSQTYWAMNIMYYTGIRVSELTQITKVDYIELYGIKCLSINTIDDGEASKTVKTENAKRNIPICQKLLDLDIWNVKPVMKYGNNRTMAATSESFKDIGLTRSTHCFRHSLSNRLRDVDGVEDSTRNMIMGHAQETITDRVYISRLPLKKMLKALNDAN